jgi:hypothetical protein
VQKHLYWTPLVVVAVLSAAGAATTTPITGVQAMTTPTPTPPTPTPRDILPCSDFTIPVDQCAEQMTPGAPDTGIHPETPTAVPDPFNVGCTSVAGVEDTAAVAAPAAAGVDGGILPGGVACSNGSDRDVRWDCGAQPPHSWCLYTVRHTYNYSFARYQGPSNLYLCTKLIWDGDPSGRTSDGSACAVGLFVGQNLPTKRLRKPLSYNGGDHAHTIEGGASF